MKRAIAALPVLACAVVVLATAGCGGGDAPADAAVEVPAGSRALLPVTLPDLSRLRGDVRERIERAWSAVERFQSSDAAPPPSAAEAYGELGKVLLTAEFPEVAETCFLNAAALDRESFLWSYYLGHLYRGRGDNDAAIDRFERALAVRPRDLPALAWLGRTYLEKGLDDRAEPLFERLLTENPESAVALYHLGKIALGRKDHARAVEQMERALEITPGASIIHYPLALAYRGLGKLDEAEAHLAQRGETDLYPYDPWMEELRGSLSGPQMSLERGGRFYRDGRYAEAEQAYREGLAEAPDEPSLLVSLGSARFMQGDRRGAEAEYRKALAAAPDHTHALYGVGAMLEIRGDDAGAAQMYRRALAADPGFPPALLRLGHVARRGGRHEEALSSYRALLQVDPLQAEARFGASMSLVRLGRYAEARRTLEEGVQLLPGQPVFVHALARLLAASPDDSVRDGPRALELLRQLDQSRPNTDLAETIAMALAEVGQFDKATEWQRGASEFARRAGDPALADAMAGNLRRYESGQPCRVPWRDGDPVFVPAREAPPAPPLRESSS